MQSVSCMIWTRVAVSISYDDNDYTTGTSAATFLKKWNAFMGTDAIFSSKKVLEKTN